jgi:cell division protein ZapE
MHARTDAPSSVPVNATDAARQLAQERGFQLDSAQTLALTHFERVNRDLFALEKQTSPLKRLFGGRPAARGLYLWGGVGRGKTFLMDSFFHSASIPRKRRIHFHRFMQEIHHGLRDVQGQADPMMLVARNIAREIRLLCLDEFHITDITDAMLMRRLLEGMFAEGIVLVTTSNFQPDRLYEHGLQRPQFVPAIDLIKQKLEVVNVDGGSDYRLRAMEEAGVYHIDDRSDAALEHAFHGIARHEDPERGAIEVEGRDIMTRCHAHGVAWFGFSDLCEGPRGKDDNIELARRYHTVLISGVPCFGPFDGDKLRRFVWLVDEFYDRRVKIIVGAAAMPEDLFVKASDADAFHAELNASLKERLTSRLTEMQMREYLVQPHLP